jgi:hypothetical protein
MKHLHFLAFALCWLVWGHLLKAQSIDHYSSLDPSQPIEFKGNCLRYADKEIILGPKTFFVDGQLSDREVAGNPYVFNSFNKAAANFSAGTEAEPMKVYLAPYVYWIDDPDDPAIRVGKDGREPFGLVVKCPYLHIIGLNTHPENTVLASSRGQTQGAVGNFTMFDFWGDGLLVKDLTMGNFCNVDLEYPLKKELSRKKRMSAITQAHVAYCHGDKIVADNVHFISRLNMNPLNGAKRILFNKCHMESTDDALTGTGVYLDCTLHFYGQKPFWRSDMGGAVFLNCDFYVCHEEDRQYFCKSVGPLSIVDCRYHSKKPVYAGWTHDPTDWLRCYQYNVKLNGQPYVIGADKPYNTVCMDQLKQLKAFRLEENEEVVYNTYNLLRGEDDWDPLQVKDRVIAIGKRDGRDYTRMPSCLSVEPLTASIQTGGRPSICFQIGGRTVKLTATVKRHCNYVLNNVPVKWKVQQGYEKDVKLSTSEGYECVVEATNTEDETKHFTVIAYTEDGLECATELTVAPDYVPAPSFTEEPELNIAKGVATVSYALNLNGRKDESLITWYRCTDRNGTDRLPVSVSRLNEPEYSYTLVKEDVGYYLMAAIAPKHLRCLPGEERIVVSNSPIKKGQVNITHIFETDFQNFPCKNQPQLLPGFWTIGGYKPLDTAAYDWQVVPDKDYWIYGPGMNGSHGTGLLQDQKGARLLYTPLDGSYGDMAITLNVDASKTAGQGFGSATGQYLDLYIKFDTRTLTGYALRIIRTTKYSNAVDFILMKYENGVAEAISQPVSSTCYRTNCTLTLTAKGGKLTAHASTTTPLPAPVTDPNLKLSVDLEADIASNTFGGTGIQHTGSCGESTTMLHYMKVEWE